MRFVGIDPSTKTGFVALDLEGNVLRAKELTGIGDIDPYRMRTLIHEVKDHVRKGDYVCIEGFGFASQQGVQNGGIGWGMRMMLDAKGIPYFEPAPNQVKKFVGVGGWTVEEGKKRRLQGKEKKDAIKEAVREQYTFCHPSDNVNDAFVLAQIARHLYLLQNSNIWNIPSNQKEVLETILNPPEKKKRKKVVK
ncbi:hypothetical protein P4V54_09115 [Brevibacillus nitrificans]|uniref:hypothetical protein n=1 Tax=Brevibacillus nitrificans TaxID=651560 RepID=UPI002E22585C|nr:hypothetical protein [Brevibacillus nitrificans]